ncbi:DUF4232 domain-containing protein [Streptomyces sp. NBC_00669]|uniref:DUF4232 domain-containing protein n=1 Tax=unclassified Streptomyces TaxID=2593676 RepID=UPI002E30B831|nr:DUF4232 domain-containing protein [Streptomyces sp. NBC_00669]
MFSIRNPRLGLVGAAATVVLAALSLTACSDDGSGSRNEGASTADVSATLAPSAGASSAAGSTAAGSADGVSAPATTAPSGIKPSAGSGATRPAAKGVPTKVPAASGKPVTCQGSDTKVVAAPLNRPVNHMLLTVTNTGSKTCYLYNYPELRFTGAQAVPPVIKDSVPQAVVTLEPGQSGYASVALSASDGSGTNGRTVKSLEVYFSGRSGVGSVGTAAHPPLPAKGVYIDDSLATTYWQQTMDLALAW